MSDAGFASKESEIGFVKDNACENAEFRVVFTAMPESVVSDDDRTQTSG
ncbi:hypothetical protein L950_0232200 [Sphingobacterium sp. IITKGP-BTPF85]|nr:hypothetical protein L950_0232200 [Sphingobacterium sp. IITKGP-BTPF85]